MTTINPATSVMSPTNKPITPKGGGSGAIDFSSLITASANQMRGPKQPIKVPPVQANADNTVLSPLPSPVPTKPVHQVGTTEFVKRPTTPSTDQAEQTAAAAASAVKGGRGGVVSCPIELA